MYVAAVYPLPSLQTTNTVTADGTSDNDNVDLPDDFHSNLFRVVNKETTRPCKVVLNYKVLTQMHDGLTKEGDVVDVAAENGVLYFRKIPETSQDLDIFYNQKPTELTDANESSPECLPSHLHQPILISYILYDKFSEIEEEAGNKPNAMFYWQRFLNGMESLRQFYPNISLQNVYQRFARLQGNPYLNRSQDAFNANQQNNQ
jgi:hypothetical protein